MVGESFSVDTGDEMVESLAGEKEFFRVYTEVNAKYLPCMIGRSGCLEKVKRCIDLPFDFERWKERAFKAIKTLERIQWIIRQIPFFFIECQLKVLEYQCGINKRNHSMSNWRDYTTMGGLNTQFPSTEWTRVIEPAIGQNIQKELVHRYWKPVYCYLRHKGCSNEEAKDLTQGFFTEIILDSNLFSNIDRTKGKFRSLLLTALNHYIIDVARHDKRLKRHPGVLVPLQDDLSISTESLANPEAAFDYAWATDVLNETLKKLEAECRRDGLVQHWDVFQARILRPIFEKKTPESIRAICQRLGIVNKTRASNMIVTVKRRFKQLLERNVGKYVDSNEDVSLEIRRLLDLFGQGST